jgi:hypothetical protein
MSVDLAIQVVGLLGDGITFTGAYILAKREAGEKDRTQEVLATVHAIEHFPELGRLKLEIDGIVIANKDDVEIAVAQRSSRQALWGKRILAIGFFFIFVARLLETIRVVNH